MYTPVYAREQKFPFLPFVTKIFHLEGKSLRTVADLVDMPIRVTGQTIRGILRFRSNGTWLLSPLLIRYSFVSIQPFKISFEIYIPARKLVLFDFEKRRDEASNIIKICIVRCA